MYMSTWLNGQFEQCKVLQSFLDISLMGWPANRLKICLESSLSTQTARYIWYYIVQQVHGYD